MTTLTSDLKEAQQQDSAWGAVASMSLCVALLIASEFMPVSLLTPISDGLGATKGQVGQAVSTSGLFAVVASLLMTTAAGHLNRRGVLLAMATLMVLSLVLMAMAPNFPVLMVSRAILGICIGGFWALGTAVIMRLVAPNKVSTALAVMFTGQAVAAAFAAPIGSYLGDVIGWRGVFGLMVPVAAINLLWQWRVLPSMPTTERLSFGDLLVILQRPHFARGMAAVICAFSGTFAMFSYLRPFLEGVTGVDVSTLTKLFLVLGVTGFLGTWAGGRFATNHVIRLLQLTPLIMALVTLGLLGYGHQLLVVSVLLAIWGAMNTALPISWMTWLSQTVDDAPEAAGSLMVAAIQAAILLGGAIGGVLLDHVGITATLIASVIFSGLAWVLVGSGKHLLKTAS